MSDHSSDNDQNATDASATSVESTTPPADTAVTADERQATIDRLRGGVVEDRITLEEFANRTREALRVTTKPELDALTGDLPTPKDAPKVTADGTTKWDLNIFGGGSRKGRWTMPSRLIVINLFGGANIDCRGATMSSERCEIVVISIFGGGDIVVPPYINVQQGGFALFGGNDVVLSNVTPPPEAPTIDVEAYSFFGGTKTYAAV